MKDQAIHSARVYLREARSRRHQSFSWTLLEWAGNARRRAAACVAMATKSEPAQPVQGDLFGGGL